MSFRYHGKRLITFSKVGLKPSSGMNKPRLNFGKLIGSTKQHWNKHWILSWNFIDKRIDVHTRPN